MGALSHPPDGQTVRGLRTTWLAACCLYATQCCDQGTLHTSLTPQAGLWLCWFSWLSWGGVDMEGGGRRGCPFTLPLAPSRALRNGGFLGGGEQG